MALDGHFCDYLSPGSWTVLVETDELAEQGRHYHERLIDSPEREIRSLLDALALPFDPACLRFHENKRAVRTASSEQVREPINRKGIGVSKPYERWLGPLREALGPLADS